MVNAVAAMTFMVVATNHIDWSLVALISSGAFIGGYLGARFGRKLSPAVLRVFIVVIGSLALVKILLFDDRRVLTLGPDQHILITIDCR